MSVSDLMQMAEYWRKQARETCQKTHIALIPKKRWAKHCLKQAKLFDDLYERKAADPTLKLP